MPLQCVAGGVWQASLLEGARPRVQRRSQRAILDYGPGPPRTVLTPRELLRAPGTPASKAKAHQAAPCCGGPEEAGRHSRRPGAGTARGWKRQEDPQVLQERPGTP